MVELMFIKAFYKKPIELTEKAIKELKPYKSIALFASVQFINLDKVIEQLKKENKQIITTHSKRTPEKFQLLGCDCYQDSFKDKDIFNKADIILYIGDGLFHPKALLITQLGNQTKKDIIIFNPLNESTKKLTKKDIEPQIKKYKANLIRFIDSDNIGILVSTKQGQSYLKNALELKNNLSKKRKEAYIFIDDNINLQSLENFSFIHAWVNTACPRIGFDDLEQCRKPLLNINDAFEPEKAIEKYSEA